MTAGQVHAVTAILAVAVVIAVAVEFLARRDPDAPARARRAIRARHGVIGEFPLPPAPDRWPLPAASMHEPTVKLTRPDRTQPLPMLPSQPAREVARAARPWEAPW